MASWLAAMTLFLCVQVVAVLLVMAATIVICIMAHVLINLEMRLGFQKIEKRVSTEFEAQRENRKQVSFAHSCVTYDL